jgi:type IV pilus assembly protein PilE
MNTCRAFSLIELLIVLVLLGILTAVALPTYDEYILRSHRAEARTALLQAALRLEREATATGVYPNAALPESLAAPPGGRYRIARVVPTNSEDAGIRFALRATPQGAQARDRCGTFTLSNTGERGLSNNSASVADCWNR